MQIRKLIILIVIVLVAILGVLGVTYFIQQTPSVEDNEPVSQEEIDTSGWKTYRNEEFGFEFKYPNNFNIVVEEENGPWFNLVIASSEDEINKFIFSSLPVGFEDAQIKDKVLISNRLFNRSVSDRKNFTQYQIILDDGFYITYNFKDKNSEKIFDLIIFSLSLK